MFLVRNKTKSSNIATRVHTTTTLVHSINELSEFIGVQLQQFDPSQDFDYGFTKSSMIITFIHDIHAGEVKSRYEFDKILKHTRQIYDALDMITDEELAELTGTNEQFAVVFRRKTHDIGSHIHDQAEEFN